MNAPLAAATSLFRHKFDGVIRIELDDGANALWVDGRTSPPSVSDDAPANVSSSFCLWRTSRDTFGRITAPGARQLEAAYISGRLAISGDMSVMARLKTGE